jgi:peptidoglycan/LPS O-acetylase OafA/YrhL
MASKSNNFDLIRLVAAAQVVVVHLLHHQGLTQYDSLAALLTRFFPGVPVFFFVSGFLISQSFDKNPSIVDFTLNRCLRIYPALIACFLVSVLSVIATGYFQDRHADWIGLAGWTAAQLSFLQFYNPDFMRHYGTGVLNGSVWTIGVELQFYMLTPLIYKLVHSRPSGKSAINALWLALILVFVVANRLYAGHAPGSGKSMMFKLLGVTFIPWVYMFLAGAFVQYNFKFFHSMLSGRFLPVFVGYLAIALLAEHWLGWGFGNLLNPVFFLALMLVIFAAAFSYPTVSDRVLRRNDISYGVYIYHMPVINLLLAIGYGASIKGFWIAAFATVALAFVSWFFVEKPALSFKRRPLYRHETAIHV